MHPLQSSSESRVLRHIASQFTALLETFDAAMHEGCCAKTPTSKVLVAGAPATVLPVLECGAPGLGEYCDTGVEAQDGRDLVKQVGQHRSVQRVQDGVRPDAG